MTEYWYGGDIAGYVVTAGVADAVTFAGGSVITAHNARTGGTQYTLHDETGVAVSSVTSGDGSDGYLPGALPRLTAPAPAVWMSADGGPRELVITTDVGDIAVAAQIAASQALGDLAAHIAARNPHATRLLDLSGVDIADATAGQLLGLTAGGTWEPTDVPGVSGVAKLADDNAFTGSQRISPIVITAPGQTWYAPTGQTAERNSVYVPGSTTQRASYLTAGGDERRSPSSTTATGRKMTALPGQVNNLDEWADSAGTIRAWVDPAGRMRAINTGHVFAFSLAGTLATTTGTHRIYNDTGTSLIIRAVRASVGTAPTGAAILVDVNIDGTTAFSTQANRPSITASTNTSGRVTAINNTTLPDGSYLTVDVDQVGSTVQGANLVVQVLCY